MKKRYRKGIGKGTGKDMGRLLRRCAAEVVAEMGKVENVVEEEQNNIERIDMNNSEECNHTEEIAREMLNVYMGIVHPESNPVTNWGELSDAERFGWLAVAGQALPIIGKHALKDATDYFGGKAASAKGWKKWLYLGVGIIIAGILGGGALLTLGGCGHNVDVTPERTEVCKDGSCLVVEPGHISYSQAQPETVVPPVVQSEGK